MVVLMTLEMGKAFMHPSGKLSHSLQYNTMPKQLKEEAWIGDLEKGECK